MSIQGVTLPTQANALQYDVSANGKGARVQPAQPDSSLANGKPEDSVATKNKFSPEELKKATDNLNKVVNLYASELKFTIDDTSGIDVVKVINTDTKEVIRQIPSEEAIKIAESIDRLQGLLVRQQA